MFATFFILMEQSKLSKVIDAYKRIGISNTQILDSQGIGKSVSTEGHINIPLIAGTKKALEPKLISSKTIVAVVEDIETVNHIAAAIEDAVGKLKSPDIGLFFSVPLASIFNFTNEPSQLVVVNS